MLQIDKDKVSQRLANKTAYGVPSGKTLGQVMIDKQKVQNALGVTPQAVVTPTPKPKQIAPTKSAMELAPDTVNRNKVTASQLAAKYKYSNLVTADAKEWEKRRRGEANKAERTSKELEAFYRQHANDIESEDWSYIGSTASALPSVIGGIKASAKGGAVGAIAGAGTAGLAGAAIGGTVGSALSAGQYTADVEGGLAYKEMVELGIPDDIAKKVAADVGLRNAGIEGLETVATLATAGVGKLAGMAGKAAAKTAINAAKRSALEKALAVYGINIATEGAQEGLQEASTIAGERKAAGLAGIERDDSQDWRRVLESAKEGSSANILLALLPSVGRYGIETHSNKTGRVAQNEANTTATEQATEQDFVDYSNPNVIKDIEGLTALAYDFYLKAYMRMGNMDKPTPAVERVAQKATKQYIAEIEKERDILYGNKDGIRVGDEQRRLGSGAAAYYGNIQREKWAEEDRNRTYQGKVSYSPYARDVEYTAYQQPKPASKRILDELERQRQANKEGAVPLPQQQETSPTQNGNTTFNINTPKQEESPVQAAKFAMTANEDEAGETQYRKTAVNSIPKAIEAGVEGMADVDSILSEASKRYVPESMEVTQQKVWSDIAKQGGVEPSYQYLLDKKSRDPKNAKEKIEKAAGINSRFTAADHEMATELIKAYAKNINEGDLSKAANLTEILMREATQMGRSINYLKMLQRNTPEGFLVYTQRQLQDLDIQLTQEEINDITLLGRMVQEADENGNVNIAAYKGLASPKLAAYFDKIEKQIEKRGKYFDTANILTGKAMQITAEKKPSTFTAKFRACQRISMLSNPKTHIRNVGGNLLFALSDTMAAPFTTAADVLLSKSTGQRTATVLDPITDAKAAFKGIKQGVNEVMVEAALGINTNSKYSEMPSMAARAFNPELAKTPMTKELAAAFNKLDNAIGITLRLGDNPAFWAQYYRVAEQLMKANKTDKITEEMHLTAFESALRSTFQDDNIATDVMQTLRNTLDIGYMPLGSTTAPFVKTPTNVIKIAVEHSPAVAIEVLVKLFYGENSLKTLKATGQSTMALQRHIAELIGRGSVGTGLLMLGMLLKAAGEAQGEDADENKRYTALNRAMGRYPNTFKIGDYWADFSSLQLSATPVIAGAAAAKEGNSVAKNVLDATLQMGNTVGDMPVLTGIRDLIGGRYEDKGIPEVAASLAGNAATQVIPFASLGRQINYYTDEYQRARNSTDKSSAIKTLQTAAGKAAASIPGLSDDYPVKYDVLGYPMRSSEAKSEIGRAFNAFINPLNVHLDKSKQDSGIAKEIDRLYKSTGEVNVLPKTYPVNITDNGTPYRLSPAEQQAWQKNAGVATRYMLMDIANDPAYKAASDKDKAVMFAQAVNMAGEYAKHEFLRGRGLVPGKYENKFTAAKANGIDTATYFKAMAEKKKIKASPTSYSGEQRDRFDDWLDGENSLTAQQKLWLHTNIGGYAESTFS